MQTHTSVFWPKRLKIGAKAKKGKMQHHYLVLPSIGGRRVEARYSGAGDVRSKPILSVVIKFGVEISSTSRWVSHGEWREVGNAASVIGTQPVGEELSLVFYVV